ncbi:chemotaxis response regulator protein-glutamate methylesterase [Nocardioides psychrotolerans]|uniref:protein-glutamate methylesterase/protein-glutamine glutaminase n=1 Tax=Nocardioides psychrotolerans TaxID=1005945 RepID=UPI003137F54C
MIRVLVVDDSAVLRRLITSVLAQDPAIEVVGAARDGLEAIEMVDALQPDAVTLDVEMPRLDGLGALAVIHPRHPRLPIIMFSTLTERGAASTLEALSNGASDYVTKPSNTGSMAESMTEVREQLVPRIKALAGARRVGAARPVVRRQPAPRRAPCELLVVASSTGGPDALAQVLAALPGDLPVPVLVAQHMPPVFTTMFAERLDRVSALSVREAVDGDLVVPGLVLVAPGDRHLRISRVAGVTRARLDDGPKENFCRPAADPLFRSAAETFGDGVGALVLTGMGHDGLAGCREIAERQGRVLVQDEATSVVWGMPGAVANAGLADEVVPLGEIAGRLASLVAGPLLQR